MFFNFMPRWNRPEASPHKGDAVAVLRVDIGLHLEDETGDLRLLGRDRPRLSGLWPRRRSQFADPGQQFAHPEIVERTAEIDRRQMALAIGLRVEGRAQPLRHFDLLAQFGEGRFRQQPRQFRVVEAAAAHRLDDSVVDAALEQQERIGEEVIGAEKVVPHADRPGGRGHVERQRLLDLVQQVERVAGLAVELVDKGDDRHVAQPAHLEELAGLLLDAPWVPLGAASSTITALSTVVRVRYVSSLKSWWPGVSRRLKASP